MTDRLGQRTCDDCEVTTTHSSPSTRRTFSGGWLHPGQPSFIAHERKDGTLRHSPDMPADYRPGGRLYEDALKANPNYAEENA